MTDHRVDQQTPQPVLEPVLELRAAGRRYDQAWAVLPVSLSLGAGTATLVSGRNGSGKSTLLRMAAGLLRPTTGTRHAPGRSLYLLSGHGARSAATAMMNLAMAIRLSGGSAAWASGHARQSLDEVGLASVADQPAGTLSSGQRARLSLAVALACPVPLVCLDEPTAHLDDEGSTVVVQALERLRGRGTALLVASHDPASTTWPVDARLHLVEGRIEQDVASVPVGTGVR